MKLRYIDALRGLAILGVLVVHCGQYGRNEHLPSFIQTVVLRGAYGVQLFYVVSAFTLFLTLDKGEAELKPSWFDFYMRRFFRIAPMYYLAILYYLWQNGLGPRYWLGDAAGITPANILSNVLFIHGFNPYWITSVVPGGWSIAVEMLFYCLIPLLFINIKNVQQAFIFFLTALILRAALQFTLNRMSVIESERLWQDFLNLYLPSQLPVFALGVLFYFIVKNNYKASLSPLQILVLSLILIAEVSGIPVLPNHVLAAIGFVVLAVALSKCEFRIFVNPVSVYMGRVSYSIYLVHFAVLFWLNEYNAVDYLPVSNPVDAMLNYSVRLLVLILLSVIISSCFYYLIELRFQRIGKKLINKVKNRFAKIQPEMGSLRELSVLPASLPGHVLEKNVIGNTSPDTSAITENGK
ncbi:MAG: acyltransferase [Cyclobacteriaceae bacterium]